MNQQKKYAEEVKKLNLEKEKLEDELKKVNYPPSFKIWEKLVNLIGCICNNTLFITIFGISTFLISALISLILVYDISVITLVIWVLLLLVVIGIPFLVYYILDRTYENKVNELNSQISAINIQLQRLAEEERIDKISQGEWVFPCEEFYDRCIAEGFDDPEHAMQIRKMKIFADQIIKSKNVPSKYLSLYNSDEQIKKYYLDGKACKYKALQDKIDREQEEYLSTKTYDLTNEMKKLKNGLNALFPYSAKNAIKKRESMSNLVIKYCASEKSKIDDIIKEEEKFVDAILSLSVAAKNSAAVTPKQDWSIWGGIAEGLAGSAAGAAVAYETILENQKIEAKNARNQAYADKLSNDFLNVLPEARAKVEQVRKENADSLNYLTTKITESEAALLNLDTKIVVDDFATETLFENLVITPKLENEKLVVAFKNKFSYTQKGFCFAIDGTIKVKVYSDDQFLEDIVIPLPVAGVTCCGGTGESFNFVTKYRDVGNYSFKVEPNHLWLIEE